MFLNEKTAIIFTHIPKCAGTSLRESIIVNNIESSLIYRSGSFKEVINHKKDFRYIIGHWPYGIENYCHFKNPIRNRKKLHITFLREPIDHLISFFYFQKQQIGYSAYKQEIGDKSIVEFYESVPRALNLQTKFCAGVFYEQLFRRTSRAGSKIQLNKAKQNLIKRFDFVGQFENYTNDLELMSKTYNLKLDITHNNVTKTHKRIAKKDLSLKEINKLKELNALDMELYKFASEKIFSNR
ncbi:sulfotransferase family 2 domain-containing protein [Formosa sp. S-31]|uniref:sulfotransferase family 2 domain-containing protein n=1 Tax=Formosa sp. S-31 TaxID=2790949 RepID=UPI003EB87DB5